MALSHSPRIITDGLVLFLDAANKKSLNTPLPTEHGWADWYCTLTSVATYSIVDTGVSIYQRTPAGVVTTVVSASTGPTRGTLSVTAGNFYYGDGPINLIVEDGHQCLVPLTVAGTVFWSVAIRNVPISFYVFSPYGNATVNFYDAAAAGINSTPTSTVTVNQNSMYTYITNNLSNVWISSNMPVVVTVSGNGADKAILHPMSNYVYRRFPQYPVTAISTTPSSLSSYAIYDVVNKTMDMNIADGAGLDCNQGLGLEYLSDTYSWGNYLSDYVIVSPYGENDIKVEYWDTVSSSWKILEVHRLRNGTLTIPAQAQRDGSAGVGVPATNINGTAAYFNTSQLWKWTGTNPFYLVINDTADDEFTLLGWTQASYNYKPRSTTTCKDLSSLAYNATFANGIVYSNSINGLLQFSRTSQTSINVPANSNTRMQNNQQTYSVWLNIESVGPNEYSELWNNGGNPGCTIWWSTTYVAFFIGGIYQYYGVNVTNSYNTWMNITVVLDLVSRTMKLYKNGSYVGVSPQWASYMPPNGNINIGGNLATGNPNDSLQGKMSAIQLYNRELTADEIRQNFNALRGRFGV